MQPPKRNSAFVALMYNIVSCILGVHGFKAHTHTHTNSEKYWTIDLKESSEWLVPTDVEFDEVAKAVVYISACQPLPAGTCGDVNDQSTVCQQLTLTNGTTLYFDMGTFNDSVGFKPIEGMNMYDNKYYTTYVST